MTWPPGKIAPCASCDRIQPLQVIDNAPICADCAHERLATQTARTDGRASTSSSTGPTIATDGGGQQ